LLSSLAPNDFFILKKPEMIGGKAGVAGWMAGQFGELEAQAVLPRLVVTAPFDFTNRVDAVFDGNAPVMSEDMGMEVVFYADNFSADGIGERIHGAGLKH
jgi:hypothetical protein